MATINVSDKQKQRVVKVVALLQPHFPDFTISQATVVNMGMALLETKYKNNTK